MNAADHYYQQQEESVSSCLLALKEIILGEDPDITEAWKYGMPFFCYKGKMFCYLWVHKKYAHPYIGFVEGKHLDHPDLLLEKRARMKIMLFHPAKDLPVATIRSLLQQLLHLYKTGIVKTN